MVELILSMFVLSILSLLLVNVLGGAMQTSEMANRVAGQASDFRETFERIGSMISVADVGSGKAFAVVKDDGIGMPGSKNDAMVLVTGARPQSRSGTRSDLYTSGAVVGFRVTAPVVDADTQQLISLRGFGDVFSAFPRFSGGQDGRGGDELGQVAAFCGGAVGRGGGEGWGGVADELPVVQPVGGCDCSDGGELCFE
jgi:type II secretory pathway pseudopilin PulG